MSFYKETLKMTESDVVPLPGLVCRHKFTYLKEEVDEEEKYLVHNMFTKAKACLATATGNRKRRSLIKRWCESTTKFNFK